MDRWGLPARPRARAGAPAGGRGTAEAGVTRALGVSTQGTAGVSMLGVSTPGHEVQAVGRTEAAEAWALREGAGPTAEIGGAAGADDW